MSAFGDFISELFNGTKRKTDEYHTARQDLEKYVQENARSPVPEKTELPKTPEYERMKYTPASDGEIASLAEKELASYYNDGKNGIDAEIESLRTKYGAEKEAANKAADGKAAAVYEAYGAAKENASNDALKRGLARSSIAALISSELDGKAAKETSDVYRELYASVNEIDGRIADLDVKKQKALNDFNIAYASKLTGKINELKSERDKKITEALKYNNSLTESEYKAEIDRKMKESDLYGEALSQRKAENELKENARYGEYGAVYEKMRDVLSKLDPADAREEFLGDPIYRDNLNDYYFYKLYDEFGRRG